MLDLPPEIQLNVLRFLHAQDILAFGRTCRAALSLISPENALLWRSAFLHDFDLPGRLAWPENESPQDLNKSTSLDYDWFGELKQRLLVFRLIADPDRTTSELTDDAIAACLLSILDDTKGTPRDLSNKTSELSCLEYSQSRNRKWLSKPRNPNFDFYLSKFIDTYRCVSTDEDTILATFSPWASHRHFTRSLARTHPSPRSNAICKLHVLFGLTDDEYSSGKGMAAARRVVYDMSLTSEKTDYGPFRESEPGGINWQLLEAIGVVVGRNVRHCARGLVKLPLGLSYSFPFLYSPDPAIPEDWAGVKGTWFGTYCFLDYQDLFNYNLGGDQSGRPSLDGHVEACGDLMKLDLKIDNSHTVTSDWRLQTRLPERGYPPPIFFSGFSMSHGDPSHPRIGVRGKVSLLPSGREVRWRYIIR